MPGIHEAPLLPPLRGGVLDIRFLGLTPGCALKSLRDKSNTRLWENHNATSKLVAYGLLIHLTSALLSFLQFENML
jgi:hypothetical protein